MKQSAENYFEQKNDTQSNLETLKNFVDIADETALGKFIFQRVTDGKAPNGFLTCRVKSPYFIIVFGDESDYAAFLKRNENIPGGTYHRSVGVSLPDTSLSLTMLAVNNHNQLQSAERFKEVEVHERQHFINDTVGLSSIERLYFRNTWRVQKEGIKRAVEGEEDVKSDAPEAKAERITKDELLAYLRDGTSPEFIVLTLQEPLYERIYKDVTGDKKMEIIARLQEIVSLLSKKEMQDIFFKNETLRARLVYLLIDVPFKDIPSFLRKVPRYLDWQEKQKGKEHFKQLGAYAKKEKDRMIERYEQGK